MTEGRAGSSTRSRLSRGSACWSRPSHVQRDQNSPGQIEPPGCRGLHARHQCRGGHPWAAMALRFGTTTDDFIDLIHVYPTVAETLKLVAISFTKDVNRLSCCAS